MLEDANLLYTGLFRAGENSAWKPEVQASHWNFLSEITKLQDEIITRTYCTSSKIPFILHERGKTRYVTGYRMRDRTIRHVFCDNILEPHIRPKIIYDNYASVKGRGMRLARERFVKFLRRYYCKYKSNKGWILCIDFSGYYDNILHYEILRRIGLNNEEAIWMLEKILKDSRIDVSYLPKEERNKCRETKIKILDHIRIPLNLKKGQFFWDKSLNIGDQASQLLGIWYPTPIDYYVKIVCGIKLYGRYMDDSAIIVNTKEEAWKIFNGIQKEAEKLGIFINKKKTKIYKLSARFRFLQIQYSLTETGRVLQKINPKRLTALRHRLKKLKKKLTEEIVPYPDIENSFCSWYGSFHRYMSKLQKANLVNLYDALYVTYRNNYSIRPVLNHIVRKQKDKNIRRASCKKRTKHNYWEYPDIITQ